MASWECQWTSCKLLLGRLELVMQWAAATWHVIFRHIKKPLWDTCIRGKFIFIYIMHDHTCFHVGCHQVDHDCIYLNVVFKSHMISINLNFINLKWLSVHFKYWIYNYSKFLWWIVIWDECIGVHKMSLFILSLATSSILSGPVTVAERRFTPDSDDSESAAPI